MEDGGGGNRERRLNRNLQKQTGRAHNQWPSTWRGSLCTSRRSNNSIAATAALAPTLDTRHSRLRDLRSQAASLLEAVRRGWRECEPSLAWATHSTSASAAGSTTRRRAKVAATDASSSAIGLAAKKRSGTAWRLRRHRPHDDWSGACGASCARTMSGGAHARSSSIRLRSPAVIAVAAA